MASDACELSAAQDETTDRDPGFTPSTPGGIKENICTLTECDLEPVPSQRPLERPDRMLNANKDGRPSLPRALGLSLSLSLCLHGVSA
jgi:hypothetical protein